MRRPAAGDRRPPRTAWLATVNAAGVTSDPATTGRNVATIMAGLAVVFVQEAGNLRGRWRLRELFARLLVGVHQDTTSYSTAGSALVWDRSRAKAGKRGRALGTRPRGRLLRTRWLAWVDLTLDDELTVRAVSCHRPPRRDRVLWPRFDHALAELVTDSPHPVIVGLDANQRDLAVEGLTWVGLGIDGLLVDRALVERVGRPAMLPRTESDHRGVVVPLRIGGTQ